MKKLSLIAGAVSICLGLAAQASVNPQFNKDMQAAKAMTAQMSLDQKIGQMTLVKFYMLQPHEGGQNQQTTPIDWTRIQQYHLGAILVAGGEVPNGHGGVDAALNLPKDYLASTQKTWLKYTNLVKQHLPTVKVGNQTVKVPMLLGIDAVHGDQTILGNTTFPQNIGLSMTHDPSVLKNMERWTAHDVKASGFNWAYAPTVAVSHSPDWGRFSETLGSEYQTWIPAYANAMVRGLQDEQKDGTINGVLATVKHFIGDGATWAGVDEGDDHVQDFKRFLTVNKAGYIGAINQGDAGSLMVSYSGVNGKPMSFGPNGYIHDLRNGSLLGQAFNGLVVSDYGGVDKAANQGLPASLTHTKYAKALAESVNAGVDLFMTDSTSSDYKNIAQFQAFLKQDIQSGQITESRINEAVEHILVAKMEMGLLKNVDGKWVTTQAQLTPKAKMHVDPQEVSDAISAAEKSFVLLKNNANVLPLNQHKIKYVVMIGESIVNAKDDSNPPVRHEQLYYNYNNIGAQNGGWTVAWQGIEGNAFWEGQNKISSGATSIQDGIQSVAPQIKLVKPPYQAGESAGAIAQWMKSNYPGMTAENTVVLGTLAEIPTAEFMGDINNPFCIDNQTTDGCLYNRFGGTLNAYVPENQPKTLKMDYNNFDYAVINGVKMLTGQNPKVVSVLLSGRPRIVNHAMSQSDAFMAAWWPGTSGGAAIANALFGNYIFCQGHAVSGSDVCKADSPNTLSVEWVNSMRSLNNYPVYLQGKGYEAYPDPKFNIGYGLTDGPTAKVQLSSPK